MRIVDLGAVYFALGLLLLVAMVRRARRTPVDAALLVVLWPLYLPVLLSEGAAFPTATRGPSSSLVLTEHGEMKKALASVNDPTVVRLLPSPQHVDKLFEHVRSLDDKVNELDEVLSRDELDLGRATRALREAETQGGPSQKHAESVLASVRRLLALRDRAMRERDELLALSRRLRLAVTVLRFSGGAEEDVGGIVAEIVGRVEGVREAFAEVLGNGVSRRGLGILGPRGLNAHGRRRTSRYPMSVTYRVATLADAAALADVGRTSFCETFAHLYAPHDLETFLAEQYTEAALAQELEHPQRRFYVADDAGQLVGFCKLGFTVSLPVELGGRRGIELKQLYLLRSHLGAGLAQVLMDWALAEAAAFGADDVVLSVYCDNARAQRFYQRYGFRHVGDHFFMVGNHRDPEHLYRLLLTPA